MENEPRYLIPAHRMAELYICVDGLIWGTPLPSRASDMAMIARAKFGRDRVKIEITPATWQMHPDSPNNTAQFTRSYE